MSETIIKVQGTFKNNTDSGKIAYANQIYDSNKSKFLSVINEELYARTQGGVVVSGNGNDSLKNVIIEPTILGNSTSIRDDITRGGTTYAITPSIVRVPYPGVTFYITLPDKIQIMIYTVEDLRSTSSFQSTSSWLSNGDTFTFNESCVHYRLKFRRIEGNNETSILPIDDFNSLLNTDKLNIKYKSNDGSVISRNADKETHVKTLISSFNTTTKTLDSMPVLIHVSDLHGDIERLKNALEYSDFINADAIINSGDATNNFYYNGGNYQSISKNYKSKYLTCIGNHEVWKINSWNSTFVFNEYIEPFIEKNEYLITNGLETDKTYYYIDIPDKKLRIIVLDTHYGNVYAQTSVGNGTAENGAGGQLGRTQLIWFMDRLAELYGNDLGGYGVVVMYHENERPIEEPSNAIYNKFFANRVTNSRGKNSIYNYNNTSGFYSHEQRPISKIVDAFISGNSITLTSEVLDATKGNEGASGGESYTVDFANAHSAGSEFICHVNGHIHMDTVGYYKKDVTNAAITNTQLVLNIGSGSPFGGGENPGGNFDLPRYWTGVTQDAFNVYVIDRYKKCVRIARIGSNQTYDEGVNYPSYMRDFMDIPYTSTNN